MEGLWTKHNIDEGCPLGNALAFLAGNTSTDADLDVRIPVLELPPATQFGEDLLLGLFTDRACIHQQQVRIIRRRC
jgi:hypothetical protein